MKIPARQNLKKIIARSRGLAPVIYRVEIPGELALQLNFLAIEDSTSVEQQILAAIESQCISALVE